MFQYLSKQCRRVAYLCASMVAVSVATHAESARAASSHNGSVVVHNSTHEPICAWILEFPNKSKLVPAGGTVTLSWSTQNSVVSLHAKGNNTHYEAFKQLGSTTSLQRNVIPVSGGIRIEN